MSRRAIFIGAILMAAVVGFGVCLLARSTLALVLGESGVKEAKELERKRSPNGSNEAIARLPVLDGLGATIAQPFEISVLRVGEKSSEEVVLVADKTEWLAVVWLDDQRLIVCYRDAKIRQFRNYWQFVERAGEAGPRLDEVEIILTKVSNRDECATRR